MIDRVKLNAVNGRNLQDVFINLGGQDDNLGDSALRAAYFEAARGEGRRFHVLLERRSSDYVTGLPLTDEDVVYTSQAAWIAASLKSPRAVQLFEAGEINPRGRTYPSAERADQLRRLIDAGGVLISAGMGLRSPEDTDASRFHPVLRDAALVSWRDPRSRDAAGFGGVAPDWAFALGTPTEQWVDQAARETLAITLRFDRDYPDGSWLESVRSLASHTGTRIVTVAQVARDAPRAVRLAEELGGEYLVAASTSHADLDAHVREVYGRSLAVISDRAHGLIIGATEGAFPIGSAANPEKLKRILATADLNALVGSYDELAGVGDRLESEMAGLRASVDGARADVSDLGARMRAAMDTAA